MYWPAVLLLSGILRRFLKKTIINCTICASSSVITPLLESGSVRRFTTTASASWVVNASITPCIQSICNQSIITSWLKLNQRFNTLMQSERAYPWMNVLMLQQCLYEDDVEAPEKHLAQGLPRGKDDECSGIIPLQCCIAEMVLCNYLT